MPILRARALALLLAALASGPALAGDRPDPADWPAVEASARGQQVWFHAWGGDPRRNDYIAWAADEVEARYGVKVTQVKLADTGEAVARVAAEKAAGRDTGGAVDLVWINGPNFAAMKEGGLLFGPWAEDLPNWRHVDVAGKPTVVNDFTVPTEGLEAPWGMAQIVFYHDTARLPEPPRSIAALGTWAAAHPGRSTYPQPPDFLGLTFLKQAAFALVPDTAALQEPVDEARYAELTRPLWAWLDGLAPDLWRGGRAYPLTGTALKQLMADGEIDLAFSFNQSEASAAIANGELPDTVRSYVLEGGTIGNANFVAIPFNAAAKEGAMVFANFLISPEAQARAQDPAVLGNFTVLDIASLAPEDRARFEAIDLGPATLSPEALGRSLPEPHPSWMERLSRDWSSRYGVGE
ncbi:ABC transporter substrate-binding protein [Rhodobacteraceae bacterium DSL-40]|uniref:ABC transporter substrate-binding protein n=1 Tax=Amaricoccus sp. B4 TaxID=3368557 RepID=UPI000DACE0C9